LLQGLGQRDARLEQVGQHPDAAAERKPRVLLAGEGPNGRPQRHRPLGRDRQEPQQGVLPGRPALPNDFHDEKQGDQPNRPETPSQQNRADQKRQRKDRESDRAKDQASFRV